MITIAQSAARALHLAAQGLLRPPRRSARKQDVLDVIRQMGALQIDTISVVARSPYFVIWSRLGSYNPIWLEELLAEGLLFEYWSHAACLLPIEDYPLYLTRMAQRAAKDDDWHNHLRQHREAADRILATIRDNGPVRSADFERKNGKSNGWWDWKPEKELLECLHTSGELMTARRENFQRLYDLRERVLPNWQALPPVSPDEMRERLLLKAVRALGITQARWIPDYFRLPKTGIAKEMKALASAGKVIEVRVDDWPAPGYVHPDHAELLTDAANGGLRATRTTLLMPFDPVVWDRERARGMFDFDYQIECYTPAAKRKYGYFTLPILYRDRLIGRLDPKAHRKNGIFEVRAIHLEPGVRITDGIVHSVGRAIRDCATWHNTPTVIFGASNPPEFGQRLQAALDELFATTNLSEARRSIAAAVTPIEPIPSGGR